MLPTLYISRPGVVLTLHCMSVHVERDSLEEMQTECANSSMGSLLVVALDGPHHASLMPLRQRTQAT